MTKNYPGFPQRLYPGGPQRLYPDIGGGGGGGGGGPATLSYRTSTSDGTDASSYTFSAQDIGNASAGRRVIVCIGWANAAQRAVTSVTIGGTAATQAAQANAATCGAAIFYAVIASGTTADIVVNLNGTATRCCISVYAGDSLQSSTPVDSGGIVDNLTTTTVSDIEVKVDGFLICFAYENSNANAITPFYDGVETEIENFEDAVEAGAGRFETWSCLTTANDTTNFVGVQIPNTDAHAIATASWR